MSKKRISPKKKVVYMNDGTKRQVTESEYHQSRGPTVAGNYPGERLPAKPFGDPHPAGTIHEAIPVQGRWRDRLDVPEPD